MKLASYFLQLFGGDRFRCNVRVGASDVGLWVVRSERDEALVSKSGKRRSFSQRLGLLGENEFRNFAARHGLIVSKVEEDFGTDFFCEIDLDHESQSVSDIADTIISACVRATSKKGGRISLSRADAQYLLRARGCVFLCLVHLGTETRPTSVHFRFVDEILAKRLRKFLNRSERRSLSVVPVDCLAESEFRSSLSIAAQPGYAESIAVRLAEDGLAMKIPDATIEVHRSSIGALTSVSTFNFYDYFERFDSESQRQLYEATFGIPSAQQWRIANLALRDGLISDLDRLPHPYVLEGLVTTEGVLLNLSSASDFAECAFTYTRNGEHYGWVHSAGASITVSRSKQVDGRQIHETAAFFDPVASTDFSDFPELTEFLAGANKDSFLGSETGFKMEAHYFSELIKAGYMARAWQSARELKGWSSGIVYLRDIGDDEVHTTMAFLEGLAKDVKSLEFVDFLIDTGGFGASEITMDYCIPPEVRRHAMRLQIPIIANTGSVTVIAKVDCHGVVYLSALNKVIGLNVNDIVDVVISVSPLLQKSTKFPEIILSSNLPTIPIGAGQKAGLSTLIGIVPVEVAKLSLEVYEISEPHTE